MDYYRAALGWVFEQRRSLSPLRRKVLRMWLKIMKEEVDGKMTEDRIIFKEFYNKDRGLPEPRWGDKVEEADIQCPTCGSTDMCYSAYPDDPEEIFPGIVRCRNCGRITDYYEAFKQKQHHPTSTPREVAR